jgi:hypothetical protein
MMWVDMNKLVQLNEANIARHGKGATGLPAGNRPRISDEANMSSRQWKMAARGRTSVRNR